MEYLREAKYHTKERAVPGGVSWGAPVSPVKVNRTLDHHDVSRIIVDVPRIICDFLRSVHVTSDHQ